MPNAKDVTPEQKPHRILALGDAGGGKTTQIVTLPRPAFAYFFDPNGLNSVQGQDIDYEEYLPESIPLSAFSLSKSKQDGKAQSNRASVYNAWEKDFTEKLNSRFFEPYQTICLDSCTTLLDCIMDQILTINGRYGLFPQQDDYAPQMITFTNIMRTLTGMNKTIYVTGHLRTDKDETLGRILRLPLVTGQLREKLPLLFSDVLVFYADTDATSKVAKYLVQTTPDKMTPRVRTAIKGLEPVEDVTIDWSQDPLGQGLGGILNWERKQLGLS